jgi:hypothetical protein
MPDLARFGALEVRRSTAKRVRGCSSARWRIEEVEDAKSSGNGVETMPNGG